MQYENQMYPTESFLNIILEAFFFKLEHNIA